MLLRPRRARVRLILAARPTRLTKVVSPAVSPLPSLLIMATDFILILGMALIRPDSRDLSPRNRKTLWVRLLVVS